VVVGQPVGVAGERGLLRQDRQPGEQGAGGIAEQVVDVADAPGGGELEGQQGQQPGDGGDHFRARVAGFAGQGGQVEGDQVGDGQQQPGEPGAGGGGEGGEVDDPGGGQVRGPPGRGRADAGLRLGVTQQPAEALLGQDLPDPGAVQRRALGRQPGGDLVDRQALPAQLDNPAAGSVLLRRALAARPPGLGEQRQPPRPPVADQRGQRRRRVAEPGGRLGQRGALVHVGADRLVPPLVHVLRAGEHLPARTRGRFRCHMLLLPRPLSQIPEPGRDMPDPRRQRVTPCQGRSSCPARPAFRAHPARRTSRESV